MRKYAMSLNFCHQIGVMYATAGKTKDEVLAAMAKDGFKPNGLTVRRIMKSYDRQVAIDAYTAAIGAR